MSGDGPLDAARTPNCEACRVLRGRPARRYGLLCSACASSGSRIEGVDDPPLAAVSAPVPELREEPMAAGEAKDEGEPEVPAVVAESERRETPPKTHDLPELVVEGRERSLVIRDLVAEGQAHA